MNFVELLYVILIYYISGNARLSPEAKRIIDEAHVKSSELLTMTPYLDNAIQAMQKGQSVDLIALSISLRDMVSEYSQRPHAKASFAEVVDQFAKWFKTQSSSSHKYLAKIVSRCEEPWIRSMVTDEVPDQTKVQKDLKSICIKMGYKGKSALTPEEALEAKASDPELYKEYLALRRSHALSWKNALSNYVKDSGKQIVPCQEALNHLADEGIEHAMPTGFTGMIDAEGNWYTKDGKLLANVPKAPVFTTITMKTKADGDADWVCKANKPNGEYAYVYTKEHNETSWNHKYQVANALIKNIEKYRKKWLANIKAPFPYENVNAVASVVIELLYLSSDRAGSTSGGNEGSQGFGMCSILCKHVTVRPDGSFLISYKGKDAVQFKFVLKPGNAKDKIICEVLKKMVDGKSPRDPVFSIFKPNGTWKPVRYAAVTSYFKSLTGGANIHKLRTVAGTGLFNTEAEKIKMNLAGKKLSEEKAIELVLKIATMVGKKLGHIKTDAQGNIATQPMTSLKNYIDFASQVQFFEFFGLPVPAYLEKMMKTDNSIQSSVMETAYADDIPNVKPVPTDTVIPKTPEDKPILAPNKVKPGQVTEDDLLTDDEGNAIDLSGGPITKRLTLRFLDGEAQRERH